MNIQRLFATELYRARIDAPGLNDDIVQAAMMLAEEDEAGLRWAEENGYAGYTSYSSLDDLPRRATCFATLAKKLQPHAAAFAEALQMDLRGKKLVLDTIWVNILVPGGSHSGHIHPHCILSGAYYARVPEGASAIRFEDPRLPMMMAAPMPLADADLAHRRFIQVAPEPGDVLLWESWLRHEVPANAADSERISVSFNYRLS